VQNAISSLVGVLLVGLALACFTLVAPVETRAAAPHPVSLAVLAGGVIASLRSVLVTYDGWYNAIYLAEETRDAERTLPRAMIGCALLVAGLYLLINLGFLHALSLPALAASKLPAADVAQRLLPGAGGQAVTALSLLTVLGVTNAVILGAPRIIYAMGRDGLISARAARLGADGNPRTALVVTGVAAGLLVLSGTLEELIAVAAIIFVLNYISAYAAVFALRRREPAMPRPFRAPGFPFSTGVVLAGSLAFLAAAVLDSPRSGLFALVLVAGAIPAYRLSRGFTAKPGAAKDVA